MNTNKMGNMSLTELQESALVMAQSVQQDPEKVIMGMVLFLRLIEEQGIVDVPELFIMCEAIISDLNTTECEQYNALMMYIENELN